jgi:hypothetical protein
MNAQLMVAVRTVWYGVWGRWIGSVEDDGRAAAACAALLVLAAAALWQETRAHVSTVFLVRGDVCFLSREIQGTFSYCFALARLFHVYCVEHCTKY